MKYYKTRNTYEASNLTLNMNTLQAYSYNWYRIVDCINGQLVLNTYRYSTTTAAHVRKVKAQLFSEGLTPEYQIEAPKGLQNLLAAIEHYDIMIDKLRMDIANPRSNRLKNHEREKEIKSHLETIKKIKDLQC